ncbi:MAG: hypothetical protein EOP83_27780, partial [Verrucomicrobiaceae bacterium]
MKFHVPLFLSLAAPLLADVPETKVETGHERGDAGFKFEAILPPASNDAGTKAKFAVVSGTMDPNSGGFAVLNDGKIPTSNDEPKSNFFFSGKGGRLTVDLEKDTSIESVATYSWHNGGRSAQKYKLYAAAADAKEFDAAPAEGVDPATKGSVEIASVETPGRRGGQYGALVSAKQGGALGKYRHLLFD